MNQTPKLLILGGGRHQIGLIKYAISQGIEVILSDYLPDSPGHKIATKSYLTSTYDYEPNRELAIKHEVNGVITTGTDQPLVVMADICHSIGLQSYLSPESARNCTNKRKMFDCIKNVAIPKYTILRSIQQLDELSEFKYPLIIKPFDSQGQRGISIVRNQTQLTEAIERAKSKSKDASVIVQEYLSGPEMTISAWVKDGKRHVMLLTDRVTYNNDTAVGVCLQHVYPSKHIVGLEQEAYDMVDNIINAYQIAHGPLYIQFIRHNDEIYLMEATCRIGGGHEDRLINTVTGVNIYPQLVNLGMHVDSRDFKFSSVFPIDGKFAMVNFIIAKEGTLVKQYIIEDELRSHGFVEGNFYYEDGFQQGPIINSMGRIGYFVCTGSSRLELEQNAKYIYRCFRAENEKGVNLVFWPDTSSMNGE
jgi:phosphoribosylaminoimidazole carboxylase (NCAIR synthetase)